MNDQTDQQLLRAYADDHSEAAFAALVRRHVDLVYSAALRMVCDAHLAQDVTQATFTALAQNANELTDRAVLSGWLHRTAQNLASKTVRTDVRRRAREQEAVAMNELLATGPDASWEQITPHLDAALGELSEPDRDALLLRYFEKKSATEMAERLGVSAEAAQKRVNRAVERLREFFSKRGITTGASGLAVVLSANAVQAAPVGLVATISAAALTSTTVSAVAVVATATKTIAMTTLQKTLVTATIAVLAGVALYEARRTSQLREQVQTLQQQQAPLTAQIQELQQERDDATHRLALQTDELAKADSNKAELLKLRGDIGVLRQQARVAAAPSVTNSRRNTPSTNAPMVIFQSVLVDNRSYAVNNSAGEIISVTIPATTEKLEIHYKSPLLDSSAPGHFAYQLRGFENDWMDAGTNCIVRYDKLPVGRYPFAVALVDTNGMEIGVSTLNLSISQQTRSVQISQRRPVERNNTNTPTNSSVRLVNEFIGTLLAVDAQSQTVTVASGSPQRANLDEGQTYFLTSETKLLKGQLPTTLADGIIGQEVRYGFRINREENKYQLTVLRFIPEAKAN